MIGMRIKSLQNTIVLLVLLIALSLPLILGKQILLARKKVIPH
jgi:hypothetical protein